MADGKIERRKYEKHRFIKPISIATFNCMDCFVYIQKVLWLLLIITNGKCLIHLIMNAIDATDVIICEHIIIANDRVVSISIHPYFIHKWLYCYHFLCIQAYDLMWWLWFFYVVCVRFFSLFLLVRNVLNNSKSDFRLWIHGSSFFSSIVWCTCARMILTVWMKIWLNSIHWLLLLL